jgi:sRNA-binding regulator protein Hfq
MPFSTPPKGSAKTKAPEITNMEPQYLRRLIERGTRVRIKLADNQEFSGVVEFYDQSFIRLTRDDGPNLFVYKHDIKYLYEEPEA